MPSFQATLAHGKGISTSRNRTLVSRQRPQYIKQYNSMPCDTMRCDVSRCTKLRYNAMQCNETQRNAKQCNATHHNTIRCNTTQHNTTQHKHNTNTTHLENVLLIIFVSYQVRSLSQIAKTIGSTLIRHRSDTSASDRCLIDFGPVVFAMWVHKFESANVLFITPTNNAPTQELLILMQEHKQKLFKTWGPSQ